MIQYQKKLQNEIRCLEGKRAELQVFVNNYESSNFGNQDSLKEITKVAIIYLVNQLHRQILWVLKCHHLLIRLFPNKFVIKSMQNSYKNTDFFALSKILLRLTHLLYYLNVTIKIRILQFFGTLFIILQLSITSSLVNPNLN